MSKYNLGFISDADLFKHIKDTLDKLTMSVDLHKFTKNIVDPIKLTIEMHAYRSTPEEAISHEIARQLGKTVENAVGWFHQNIFRYIDGWDIPDSGVDLINRDKTIFCEMKNKFNTMNSGSAERVFQKLQGIVIGVPEAITYLVEVIAKESQDIEWHISGVALPSDKAKRIRRISVDRFYDIAVGRRNAFADLCSVIGLVVDDVLAAYPARQFKNTVVRELQAQYPNVVRGLFMSSFSTYYGFGDFNEKK